MTLLSGVNGFLGRSLVARLESTGTPFVCYRQDVTDPVAFKVFLESISEPPGAYFHFAGISSVGDCLKNPPQCEAVNALAPALLASILWQNFPQCLFVFPSTATVYSASDDLLHEDSPTAPDSLYAHSKLNAERNLTEAAKSARYPLLILRLFNHSHCTQSPNFFLPSVFHQVKRGQSLGLDTVRLSVGNIDIERDFGALSDLLSAFEKILAAPSRFRDLTVANVSSGTAKRLRQIIETLALSMGVKVDIQIDPQRVRAGEPRKVVGDSTKLQQLLSWSPTDGQTVDAFVQSFLRT